MSDILEKLDAAWGEDHKMNLMHYCDLAAQEIRKLRTGGNMGEVREMLHRGTIERCAQELESGLNVHRWLDLWRKDGKEFDEHIAIAFYHQALQDGWQALRSLNDQQTVREEK